MLAVVRLACLGTAALKGAVPRSRAWCNGTHQRKEPTRRTALRPSASNRGRPQALRTTGRFLLITLPRITNTRPVYRTLASLASDSRDGRHVMRRPVQDLGAHRSRKTGREFCEARRSFPRREMHDGWKFFVVAPPLFSWWQPQSRRQGPQCSRCVRPRPKRFSP